MPTRKQILDVARTYLNTPFAHQGRTRGFGLDCVGLPLMIAQELNIVDTKGRPMNGGLYSTYTGQPIDTLVLDCCIEHLVRKVVTQLKPGDIVCMRVDNVPCHVGIYDEVNGQPWIIHAYNGGSCKVVEHGIDRKWWRRITAAFEFPGLED